MDPKLLEGTVLAKPNLTPSELQQFVSLFQKVAIKKGHILCEEGTKQLEGFIVEKGTVGRFKKDSSGSFVRIGTVDGSSGLLHLIDGDPAFARLEAEGDGIVWTITHDSFRNFVTDHPQFQYSLLSSFGRRIRELNRAKPVSAPGIHVAVFSSTNWFKQALDQVNTSGLVFSFFEEKLDARTAFLAKDCSVVCCFVNDSLDAPVLDQLAKMGIGMIAMRCAGFDRVDIERCRLYQLTVARVPAYSPYAVAEHALALLMSLNRKTHRASLRTRESNFQLEGLLGWDVHGKTAGVIGTGKIGICFIDILQGLGCNVLCYDVYQNEELKKRKGVTYVTLEQLYAQADFISLHVPLLPSTKHMINKDSIAKMKNGVTLINTSRGGLVDTPSLIAALQSGKVRAAGLDVYENEGDLFFYDRSGAPIKDNILLQLQSLPNVILTGHQAFFTNEAIVAIAETTVGNVRAWAAGHTTTKHPNTVYQDKAKI